MAAPSKAEYLKKYLSDSTDEKKKKKRRKPQGPPAKVVKSRIVDDDVDFQSLLPENLSNTLDDDIGDNDPMIADVVDERPEHVQLLEKYRSSGAWKLMGKDSKEAGGNTDSDASPPRKRHDSSSDASPPRRRRFDSGSDQSPLRRQRHDSGSDKSPPRRQRHDSGSDQSPPRRRRHASDSDQSPQRRRRHDSGSDQSPPRRQKKGQKHKKSPIPRKRHDSSDSDQSPPRKKVNNNKSARHDSDSDLSPQRPNTSSSRSSDPRHRRRYGSDSDQSPPRRSNSQSKFSKVDSEKSKKTLSGKKAGLSSAKEMRREADELKRKEDDTFRKIDDERLGKGAATVFRDKKSGKIRNLDAERHAKSEEEKQKAKEQEQFQRWGKGLKQIEDQSQRMMEALHEADKPLARYRDDNDLDQMLRDMDRAEDPMLAFITKKKSKQAGPAVKEKPRYKGPAPPPNRFGILPGYRWDGVDRSNGFEKQVFAKQAENKAISEQRYKWSIEDM